MKAKFVYESIEDMFAPKPMDEIIKDLRERVGIMGDIVKLHMEINNPGGLINPLSDIAAGGLGYDEEVIQKISSLFKESPENIVMIESGAADQILLRGDQTRFYLTDVLNDFYHRISRLTPQTFIIGNEKYDIYPEIGYGIFEPAKRRKGGKFGWVLVPENAMNEALLESVLDVLKPKTTAEIIDELFIDDPKLKQFLIDNNFIYLSSEVANQYSTSMADPPSFYYWFKDKKGQMIQVGENESLEEFLEYYNVRDVEFP
jgi:hypothetical protein